MYTFKLKSPKRQIRVTRFIALILIAFTLVMIMACNKEPISTSKTNNEQFRIEKLFDVDGCTMYRFYDGGYTRYFANCEGSVSSRQGCGKNCNRPHDIPTSKKGASCKVTE